ncbi:MAG: helicase C-terminal domain-containing protein [Clostridia bacterium]|nr:helicase C-terminal domain-containing protein [Clostridia bacterium]
MKAEPVGAVANYITSDAVEKLRRAIEEAGGAEVFAVGRCDRDFVVVEISILAVGNMNAAPVVDPTLIRGQVVMHNHPSGKLMPSDADISVAAALGARGIGFWIVDNAVDRIRPVTDPLANESGSIIIDPADIRHIFSSSGPLAAKFDGYEARAGQAEMSLSVSQAFSDAAYLVVEAGTGTGKSLAYLVPAFLWAKRNEIRVVISTNTINLQEQLIYKDIPGLSLALGEPIHAMLVKGRGNYLCMRKFVRLNAESEPMLEPEQRDEFARIASWARNTETGDRSDMDFAPEAEVWELVSCEADMCPHSRCQFFSECFLYKARSGMEKAEILVVNHHILFADCSIRGDSGGDAQRGLLPPYRAVVVDEAHNAAAVASEYFGRMASRLSLVRLLNAVYRKERSRSSTSLDFGALVGLRGHLLGSWGPWADQANQAMARVCADILDSEAMPAAIRTREASEMFFEIARQMLSRVPGEGADRILRVTDAVRESDEWDRTLWPAHERLVSSLKELAEILARLVKELGADDADEGAEADQGDDEYSERLELSAYAGRIREYAASLEFAMSSASPEYVYWIDCSGTGLRSNVRVVAAPIEGGREIANHLLAGQESVVFTSATLAVGQSFEYIRHDLGLDCAESGRVREMVVPSPFDFEKQVLLGVANDLPAPDSANWEEPLAKAVSHVLDASDGRAFVLFTSYRLLDRISRGMEQFFRDRGIRLLRQGEKQRHALLTEFRDDTRSVLFGTDSFWEGVDVPGEALSCVVIPRLPFAVPTHPVIEARIERIRANGGDAFREFTLPSAVLRFKQGFGRLIRNSTDRGAVIVLDSRTSQRFYGRHFISALPKCEMVVGSTDLVCTRLAGWIPPSRQ